MLRADIGVPEGPRLGLGTHDSAAGDGGEALEGLRLPPPAPPEERASALRQGLAQDKHGRRADRFAHRLGASAQRLVQLVRDVPHVERCHASYASTIASDFASAFSRRVDVGGNEEIVSDTLDAHPAKRHRTAELACQPRPRAGQLRRDEHEQLVDEVRSRNAVASVGPPSSRSDWTPSSASRPSSSSSGLLSSSRPDPPGRGPRPNASRRGWRTAPTSRAVRARALQRARCPCRPRPRRTRPVARGRAGGSARPTPSAITARRRLRPAWPRLVGHERAPLATQVRQASFWSAGRRTRARRRPARRRRRPRAEPLQAAGRRPGSGRACRQTTRSTPAASTRVGARRRRAVVRARLQRDVERGAPRPLAGSSSATTSAWRPPLRSVQPSPTTSPSRSTTAPTTGFGRVVPRPRSASSSARSRKLTRRPAASSRRRSRGSPGRRSRPGHEQRRPGRVRFGDVRRADAAVDLHVHGIGGSSSRSRRSRSSASGMNA